jgi:soluble cytochrome b562
MSLTRSPFVALLVAVLALGLSSSRSIVRAADEKKADEKKAADETELTKVMEDLSKALKAIKKNVKDPSKNAESLKQVEIAEKAAIASKDLPPAMLAKTPEAKKAEVIAGYKKAMDACIAEIAKLKQQLKDGKNEDAAETLKNLKTMEDDGHEKYNP